MRLLGTDIKIKIINAKFTDLCVINTDLQKKYSKVIVSI